jgi:hypothetical protein
MDSLFSVANIFLTASTILVGALSVAGTEPLKTWISAVGLVVTVVWAACGLDAFAELSSDNLRSKLLTLLPFFFAICWLVALGVHAKRWSLQRKST